MLQWMGGSRRKVTTSRRSTQKRQKQYFEQRRRKQQQQAAGLDSFEEGVNIRGENCKEHHRSLDVLSLQNWSTIAKDCTSTCHPGSPSEFRGIFRIFLILLTFSFCYFLHVQPLKEGKMQRSMLQQSTPISSRIHQ